MAATALATGRTVLTMDGRARFWELPDVRAPLLDGRQQGPGPEDHGALLSGASAVL